MPLKKICYIPGLVSIIGLPVLLFFWGPPDRVEQNTIRLNLVSPATDVPGLTRFTEAFVYKKIKGKKIVHIDLEGFSGVDERLPYMEQEKFLFLMREMARVQITGDTMSVLQVQFRAESFYSEFVWVINQALIYNVRQFAMVNNNVYFFANERVEPKFGNLSFTVDDILMPAVKKPTKWERFKLGMEYKWDYIRANFQYMLSNQQQNILLALGFIILLAIPGSIKIRKHYSARWIAHASTPVT